MIEPPEVRRSWLPMVVIAAAQIMMSSNISALPILIGGIVHDLDTPATTVGTAIVTYSLCVAGLIMLGAKLGSLLGSRLMFALGAAGFGAAMVLMTISKSAQAMIVAQAIAGVSAAVLVPTLVVMIASTYDGRQREQAVGFLLAAHALGGVLALGVAGWLGAVASWRYPFALLAMLAVIVILASFVLKKIERQSVQVDMTGVALSAAGITLISLGFNAINSWGLIVAKSTAPFNIVGMSPALPVVVLGIVLMQGFVMWSQRRKAAGKTPLLALEVLDAAFKRYAVLSLFSIVAIDAAVNFLVPLYIQIVQGRTSLETSIAIVPYSLAIFAASILVVRLYDVMSPQQIARYAFAIVAVGLTLLAFVIRNEWETIVVIAALVVVGLAQGALLTLLFSVLLTSSPRRYAGDVGSLRGVTNNMGVGLGTAIAGAMVVGILSASIATALVENPKIPTSLTDQVNLDNANFISNSFLKLVLEKTTATPVQIAEVVRINEDARLRSLKICFFILATLAALAVLPAGGLPGSGAGSSAKLVNDGE
jgi:predicted MFS family arabinose efflux permease